MKKPANRKQTSPAGSGPVQSYIPAALALIAVLALSLYIYVPGLKNTFVYDDVAYVTENPMLSLKGDALWDQVFSKSVHGNYHPLTMASLVWDFQAAQLNPVRYHQTSLILHILNSLLCGFLFFRLSGNLRIAGITSVLFAIHPLHVESVAWISERKDVLYTFFFFLAWILLDTYREKRSIILYLLAFIAFVAACMSKGMAVVLPPAILAGWYFKEGFFSKDLKVLNKTYLLVEMIPFFIVSLIFGIVAVQVQQSFGFIAQLKYTALDKIFYVAYGLVFYPVKTLLPIWLSSLYPYPMGVMHTPFWEHYAALPALLMLGGIVWYFRKNAYVIFATLFYLITISIVLQIVPVGGAITADRYGYVATAGFLFLMAWLLDRGIQSVQTPVKYGTVLLTVLCILGFTYISAERVKVWSSNKALFMDVAEKFPHDPLAFYNTANALEKEGNFREALHWYGKALQNMPDYIDALYNTGSIYGRDLANPDSGIYYLGLATKYDPRRADAWNNMGVFHFNKQQYREAVHLYITSTQIKPDYMEAWFNMGNAYMNLGIPDSARMSFEKVLQLKPDFASGYISLGNIYANAGDKQKQVEHYQQAARLGNTDAQQWLKQNNLNW